jgi:hypothetical protein|tara:strand:+ start:698 stop:2335 length:1638 start_codon:yes stop_codon:yes gene_type:complete
MAEENGSILKLFGFEIKRAGKGSNTSSGQQKLQSPVTPTDPDGAGYTTSAAGYYGQYINMDGDQAKDNHQLIMKYRGVAQHPEVDMAIEEIVNEAITASELESSVKISLDDIEANDKIKDTIRLEFDKIVSMLNFNDLGHEQFRSWYIDGRCVHHLLVNDANLKAGIQEIRHMDSAKVRKVKEIKYKKDQKTNVKIVDKVEEFYVYDEKPGQANTSVKLSTDAVSYVTSGVLDEGRKKILSHLHKALKPINQLRMMEDSLVIYRLARAPERRIFYIDVGNMPRGKANEYMKDIMSKYRNKLVYDASTGQLKDDRKHMSMLEDFWLPRKEGGRGTEISTLPGGDNLGQIDDIIYFQKRLYRSLNVPVNRLEQESQFSMGRSTEISRDEVKFQKFIDKLRRRFSAMFLGILRKQLVLKAVITEQDWEEWKDDIYIDFVRDNHFTELKEMEIYRERAGLMNEMVGFVGEYISKEWVMRNIMRFSDEDLEQMQKEIDGEISSGEVDDPDEKEEEKPPVGKAPVKPTEPKKPTPPKKATVPDDKKDEEPK